MPIRRRREPAHSTTRGAALPEQETPTPRSFDELTSAAIAIPSARVHTYVDHLRSKHPQATPEQLLVIIERRYLLTVKTSGGAVGAAAAVPAIGTVTAALLTSGQVASFLAASAVLAMATADVHGIDVDDVPRRRAVLLTALLGERGPQLLEQQLGISTMTWGRTLMTRIPLGTVKAVNKTLRRRIVAASTAKAGSIMAGRLLPFGVGAVIGYTGGKVMGRSMIRGISSAFGPPPQNFTRELTNAAHSAEETQVRLIEPGARPTD